MYFLFVWGLSSHSRIFRSYGDVTITGEGLQIFDLCSALMAIEQLGFFSMPHLLWHGASIYYGHLRGPVTLTPIAERLALELSLPVFTTWVCRGWDSNTQPSTCGANALSQCATAAVYVHVLSKYSNPDPHGIISINASCLVKWRNFIPFPLFYITANEYECPVPCMLIMILLRVLSFSWLSQVIIKFTKLTYCNFSRSS